MAENEGKTPRSKNDDDETLATDEADEGGASEKGVRSKAGASEKGESDAKRSPAKAAKARPTSTRSDDADDDDDDDDDDEYDDEDDDDEEEDEAPPPPKRPVVASKKAKPAAGAAKKPAPAVKGKGSVYRKAPVRVRINPHRPARYYVPYIGLGLAFVALHVWFDLPYQPVACLGIAIVIWAYLQIGSANEIIPDEH
ncbi:MAG: hypothetical protein MUF34_13205 [Polyangiaceae bacterium]|nr:hypothetical protein [Polyangiaceae bacterium]